MRYKFENINALSLGLTKENLIHDYEIDEVFENMESVYKNMHVWNFNPLKKNNLLQIIEQDNATLKNKIMKVKL